MNGAANPRHDVSRHFVFLTDEVPRPGQAGHLAMNHAILAWLANRGHRVTILLCRLRLDWPVLRAGFLPPGVRIEASGLLQAGRTVVALRPRDIARIISRRLLGLLPAAARNPLHQRARRDSYGRVDAVLGRFIAAGEAAWCAGRIAALRPDGLLIDTIFRAPVLQQPAVRGIRSLIVAHDVFHLRHAALAARGYRLFPPTMTAAEEIALLARADAVAAIQPEEAALLKQLLPHMPVFVAGMPAPIVRRPPGTQRLADRLVFLGSDSLHNVDGLRWFIAEIWPAIRAGRPAAALDVCGRVGATIAHPPAGISVHGLVADAAPFLHRARLAVAPLRAGSGLKIKLLDYVRHGLGVVTTPVGVAGFTPSSDWPFLVADDPAAFAALVIAALTTPEAAPDRERHAVAYAQHYSADTVFHSLGTHLDA